MIQTIPENKDFLEERIKDIYARQHYCEQQLKSKFTIIEQKFLGNQFLKKFVKDWKEVVKGKCDYCKEFIS